MDDHEQSKTPRPMVRGNQASNVLGKAYDLEYSAENAPDIVSNHADRIGPGGAGFRTRLVAKAGVTPKPIPWWMESAMWILRTTAGKLVGAAAVAIVGAVVAWWAS